MKKIFLLFLSLFSFGFLFSPSLSAHEIHLKDGKIIKTTKYWEENGIVKYIIMTGSLEMTVGIKKDLVEKIVYEKPKKPPQPPPKIKQKTKEKSLAKAHKEKVEPPRIKFGMRIFVAEENAVRIGYILSRPGKWSEKSSKHTIKLDIKNMGPSAKVKVAMKAIDSENNELISLQFDEIEVPADEEKKITKSVRVSKEEDARISTWEIKRVFINGEQRRSGIPLKRH